MRRARALLATLVLSQGVPMLLAGDEFGNSQQGNNNAYAQDNPTSWLDWDNRAQDLEQAVRALIAFRQTERIAQVDFARGPDASGRGPATLWLHPRGGGLTEADWQDAALRLIGLHLDLPRGPLLLVLNAGDDGLFALPEGGWRRVLDTARTPVTCDEPMRDTLAIAGQSVVALKPETPG